MASHFSDIGLKFTKENFENEIKNIIDSNQQHLSKVTINNEDYLILFLDNTIELWFYFDNGAINPYDVRIHYHTSSFIDIENIEKKDEEGLYYFEAENYPLNVTLPYYESVSKFNKGEKYKCQIACFAEYFDIYKDADDFHNRHELGKDFSEIAVIPIGTFEENGLSSRVDINGYIRAIDKRINSFTSNAYYLVTIESYGANYDVLIDASDVKEELQLGNIISGTFWLSGKIMPLFHGSNLIDYKRLKSNNSKIETIGDLYHILQKSWSKETAYPSCQSDWVNSDKSYGQCAITAMIVNDIFGGTIHKIRTQETGTHYFNKIENQYVDLTSEQFDLYFLPVNYENNQLVDRRWCGKNEDTNKRYQLLVNNIVKALKE